MKTDMQTISWDNSNIYQNFQDLKINQDIKKIEDNTFYLKSKANIFEKLVSQLDSKKLAELEESIPLARECYRLILDTNIMIYTLKTYAHTAISVNSLNYEAKDLSSKIQKLFADISMVAKPLKLLLLRAPLAYLDNFLNDESVSEAKFDLNYARKVQHFLLGVSEEVLLEGHSVDGYHAWGKLYTELSGNMKVNVEGQQMGLADASNILFNVNREKRQTAYRAINDSWNQNGISAAAVLNALSGWRLENNRARSQKIELHYLDKSCHSEKITRETLNTLMQTTYEQRHIGQDALRLMAQEMKIEKLGPWDILAPLPVQTDHKIPFPEAMKTIYDAFEAFSPEMAEFSQMMEDKKWIDATPSENRASGAHCTGFAGAREPRVFMTYDGSMKSIITLAHEIGHAYHSWVMRDLKFSETSYSSSLAETASIFAETLVRDYLLKIAKSNQDKKAILWQEIQSAATFLVNIPARFEFEKQMLELRKIKAISIPEFKELNKKAWQSWYGDTLTEYNEMFWASKMHFSFSYTSFYNYPYLFGYLFSLGIYAKKDEYGDKFKVLYVDILRDTGTMTAENLIKKYFNEDISKSNFWLKSIKIVENAINEFKKLS
ncbi:MAG: M3 family oligoendopeptidase [Bdellovibrionota bacterium]